MIKQHINVFNTTITVLRVIWTDAQTNTLLSDHAARILQWMLFTVLCQAIVIFGIGTNIINIMCFVKQGFKDPVNVSFMGLAISDIGSLSTLIWCNICYTPAFISADLSFDSTETCYLAGGVQHTAFTRITGCITALITLERCLCITVPLKVKSVFTSKRTFAIIFCIYVILLSGMAPTFVVNRLYRRFSPERNKTLLRLAYTENRETVEKYSYIINNVFIPFSSFTIITTCSIVLAVKLTKRTQWRKMASNMQTDHVSSRNQKVAKLVLIISALFIHSA